MKQVADGDLPLVSVVLPTYDRPEMLVEAAESVASQQYPEIELIVVDDASPTPAADILEERGPTDLDWQCFRHEHNRGANAARNRGISESNGEILTFLDDDDRWLPEKIGAQVAAFRDGGGTTGVVLTGQRIVDECGETTALKLPTITGTVTAELMAGHVAGTFSSIAIRRSAVDAAGRPDERFPALQDREWLVRLSCHCEFASIQRPLVIRQFGEYDQISDDFESRRDTTYPLFVEKHLDLAAEHGREREFVAWLAISVAGSGLANGYYDEARQFAAKAIRTNPRLRIAYIHLTLALAGSRTHRSALQFSRTLTRLRCSLQQKLGRSPAGTNLAERY